MITVLKRTLKLAFGYIFILNFIIRNLLKHAIKLITVQW
jgi:hypothetical protein